ATQMRRQQTHTDCVDDAESAPGTMVTPEARAHNAAPPASAVDDALEQLKRLRPNDKWEIAGRRLPLTNLEKPFWPDDGYTKRDMIAYYVRMADYLLPYLRVRPLSIQLFPYSI